MAAYPRERGSSWLGVVDAEGSVFLLILILIGIGAANFNATAFRSRSPWLAVDLALLLFSFWAIRRLVAPLFLFGLMGLKGPLGQLLLLSPLTVALVLANAFQLARGRTDIRRAHRAMSIAFWTTIGLALAVAGRDLRWVLVEGEEAVGTPRGAAGRGLVDGAQVQDEDPLVGPFLGGRQEGYGRRRREHKQEDRASAGSPTSDHSRNDFRVSVPSRRHVAAAPAGSLARRASIADSIWRTLPSERPHPGRFRSTGALRG